MGNIIFGAISVMALILPFVIIYFNRTKKEKAMLNKLNTIAKNHDCKIIKQEFCSDFVLGMDEVNRFVFFYRHNNGHSLSQYVDLADVQSCQPVIKTKAISGNGGNAVVTEKITLNFLPKSKSGNEIGIELYDLGVHMQLNGELQMAEQWSGHINEIIKK